MGDRGGGNPNPREAGANGGGRELGGEDAEGVRGGRGGGEGARDEGFARRRGRERRRRRDRGRRGRSGREGAVGVGEEARFDGNFSFSSTFVSLNLFDVFFFFCLI